MLSTVETWTQKILRAAEQSHEFVLLRLQTPCSPHEERQCFTQSTMALKMIREELEGLKQPGYGTLSDGGGGASGLQAKMYEEVVADILGLARCDYLIGTFTSQVLALP